MERTVFLGPLGPVCRLGLATRGGSALAPSDVRHAIDRGINYLNWCGQQDGLSRALRALGQLRTSVLVAVQLEATTATVAMRELDGFLKELDTEYIDVVTYYYVEELEEWQAIIAPGGAHEAMVHAREAGKVRLIGVTTHQRPLAASMARSGLIELLMIRYNAAHRGAEREIFPLTGRLTMPLVAYTGVRWGALLRPTPGDPPGFLPPSAADCYRFVLSSPAVAVALMAPHDRRELDEDLELLGRWEPLSPSEYASLAAHGERVRRHAGEFP